MNFDKKERIALITDSCADIPKSLIEKYSIFTIPLKVFCDDKEFLDGIEITYENVFEKMMNSKKLGTSLPDGKYIEKIFSEIANQGYTKAIAITISSGLSGTFNMLNLHKAIIKGLEVKVFDSRNCSLGQGMIVLQLADYIEKGLNWEELIKKTDQLIKNTHSFIYADTLEFLQKGGRIGKITAFAGTMLNIKPIFSVDEKGSLYSIAKTRGRKQGREKIMQLINEKIDTNKNYNFACINGNNNHEMIMLCNQLKDSFPNYTNIWNGHMGAAVSVHLGPGVLAAAVQIL